MPLAPAAEVAPDFLKRLTPTELRYFTKFYARVANDPVRYQWLLTSPVATPIHYVRLAYTLSWYSIARRFVLPLWGIVGLLIGVGVTTQIYWLDVLGALVFVIAVGALVRMIGLLSAARAYFAQTLGADGPD